MDPTKAVIGGCVAVAVLGIGGVWYANLPPAPPKPAPVVEVPKPAPEPEPPPKKEPTLEELRVEGLREDLRALLSLLKETDPEALLLTGKDPIDHFTRVEPTKKAQGFRDPLVLYVHMPDGETPQLMMRLMTVGRDVLSLRSAKLVCGDFETEVPLEDTSHKIEGTQVTEWQAIEITKRKDIIHALCSREQLTPIVVRFRGSDSVRDEKPDAKNMKHVAAVLALYTAAHLPDGEAIITAHRKRVAERDKD